jgi:integrase
MGDARAALSDAGGAGAAARRGPGEVAALFELLAATGLRISEAIGLRWSDLVLDGDTPHLQVRRAIVKGAIVAPKSRHGARLIPLTPELAARFALVGLAMPSRTRSSFRVAMAVRPIRAACAAACSSPPPSARG